ncbi:HIT domain-containing protein [bacterium]|nr:HIT domain-containing protein [bacterium]MCP5463199.1 HIT domain-containing protein [bacterium]
MEKLWAPWRIEYILNADKSGECIFCNALEGNSKDNHIIIIRDTCFALLNKYPYNSGHLMVAPKKHTDDLALLSRDELADMMELTRDCKQLLTSVMNPHGFNIGINLGRVAGAGILDHIHIHIVPRWNGDTNFMPVIGDTKVLPQSLYDTGIVLKKKAQELSLD